MAVSLHSLLTPQLILKAVSRIRKFQGRLGRWVGCQPNRYNPDTVSIEGPNTRQGDTRFAALSDAVTNVSTLEARIATEILRRKGAARARKNTTTRYT